MSQSDQDIWNAQQYLKFENDRLRPFLDLVAQMDTDGAEGTEPPDVHEVVDLGSGPGNATALLADWWPYTRILGLDSSPTMNDAAQGHAVPGRDRFDLCDIR